MNCSELNFLAIIVATLASFALGAVWYSLLFGKVWMGELGFTPEQMKGSNMARIFGTTLVLTFVMACGMAMLLRAHDMSSMTWMRGLRFGLFVGVALVGASMGINYLYQRKSFTLWAIDAGYQIAFLGLIGTILGAWH